MSSHRIYLKTDQKGGLYQSSQATEIFYDLDVARQIQARGGTWYFMLANKSSTAMNLLPGSDAWEKVVARLGARMLRCEDGWYVRAEDVDLYLAHSPRGTRKPARRAVGWAGIWAGVVVIVLSLLVMALDIRLGENSPDLRPGAMAVLGCTLSAMLIHLVYIRTRK